MTKTKLFGIITATVVVSALLGVTMISESESQQPILPTSSDVVVFNCLQFGGGIVTQSAASSANAPAVPVEPIPVTGVTNCAQNLADLLDAGFEIQDVSEASGRLFYTLIR